MSTQYEARLSVAVVAIAISVMGACAPAMNAQAPQGGAADDRAGVAAPSDVSAPKVKSEAPPPTEAECHARASAPLAAPARAEKDVKLQYDAFFAARHETFRCCFDALFAPNKPGTDAQLVLLVKVAASGKLASSEIVAGETTAQAPGMNACVLDMANTIEYPKPASSAMIGYKRTFQLRARR